MRSVDMSERREDVLSTCADKIADGESVIPCMKITQKLVESLPSTNITI